MGYFSNGTEGEIFEANWCNNCIHQEPTCPVWSLHLLWNYDQNDDEDKKMVLDMFIISRDVVVEHGPNPGEVVAQVQECKMYHPRFQMEG